MPTPGYMTVTGATQGDMTSGGMSADSVGTLSKSGQEDTSQILEFELGVDVPTDPASGQPTGSRIHTGMRVVKYTDKASPLLLQAIGTGEQLSTVKVQLYRTASAGGQEHYYTVKLDEATLVKYRPYFPNSLDEDSASYAHMEELIFQYKTITVTHEKGGTSGSDAWDE